MQVHLRAPTSPWLHLLFIALLPAPPADAQDLYKFGYDPHPDFVAFDPQFHTMHDAFSKELDSLQADMIRQ